MILLQGFLFSFSLRFFEEIAKYRAARKIWSNFMKNKYKAKNPKSLKLRFHTQTAGCSLTAQQQKIILLELPFKHYLQC